MSIHFQHNRPTHAPRCENRIGVSLHHIQRKRNEDFANKYWTIKEMQRIKQDVRSWMGKDRFLLRKALDMVWCDRKYKFNSQWWRKL